MTAIPTAQIATEEILALLADLEAAWAAGDGAAYAAGFTQDATYTAFVGTVYHGRQDIAHSHQALFDKFLKGTHLTSEIDAVRFLTADVAVITSRGDVSKKHPKKPAKVQTYTVAREADGQWRIAAFHNTKRKALMESVSFAMAPETAPADRAGQS